MSYPESFAELTLIVNIFHIVRFQADNWNRITHLCSKEIGAKMKVLGECMALWGEPNEPAWYTASCLHLYTVCIAIAS